MAQPSRRGRTNDGGRGARAESRHLALVGEGEMTTIPLPQGRERRPTHRRGAVVVVMALGVSVLTAAVAFAVLLFVVHG